MKRLFIIAVLATVMGVHGVYANDLPKFLYLFALLPVPGLLVWYRCRIEREIRHRRRHSFAFGLVLRVIDGEDLKECARVEISGLYFLRSDPVGCALATLPEREVRQKLRERMQRDLDLLFQGPHQLQNLDELSAGLGRSLCKPAPGVELRRLRLNIQPFDK